MNYPAFSESEILNTSHERVGDPVAGTRSRMLGSGALTGSVIDQPAGDTWGDFYRDHPELQELNEDERLQFKIGVLEDAAQRFEATNIEVADALREEVGRLLLEKAEPFAHEIAELRLKLNDSGLRSDEASVMKDKISDLELKYHQMMQYNPYVSGSTPYDREQLRQRAAETSDELDIWR